MSNWSTRFSIIDILNRFLIFFYLKFVYICIYTFLFLFFSHKIRFYDCELLTMNYWLWCRYILTLNGVKILFGFGVACLLVQLLFVSYYAEIRSFYNVCTTKLKYNASSTHSEPKSHLNFSNILNMVSKPLNNIVSHTLYCLF